MTRAIMIMLVVAIMSGVVLQVAAVGDDNDMDIIDAAAAGNVERANIILTEGDMGKIQVWSPQGQSALQVAAENGHHLVVDALLAHNNFRDVAENDHGRSYTLAVEAGHTEVVTSLIKAAGAESPIYTIPKDAYKIAFNAGHMDIATSLINAARAEPPICTIPKDALIKAIASGDSINAELKGLIRLLAASDTPCDINYDDGRGTALFTAITKTRLSVVSILCETDRVEIDQPSCNTLISMKKNDKMKGHLLKEMGKSAERAAAADHFDRIKKLLNYKIQVQQIVQQIVPMTEAFTAAVSRGNVEIASNIFYSMDMGTDVNLADCQKPSNDDAMKQMQLWILKAAAGDLVKGRSEKLLKYPFINTDLTDTMINTALDTALEMDAVDKTSIVVRMLVMQDAMTFSAEKPVSFADMKKEVFEWALRSAAKVGNIAHVKRVLQSSSWIDVNAVGTDNDDQGTALEQAMTNTNSIGTLMVLVTHPRLIDGAAPDVKTQVKARLIANRQDVKKVINTDDGDLFGKIKTMIVTYLTTHINDEQPNDIPELISFTRAVNDQLMGAVLLTVVKETGDQTMAMAIVERLIGDDVDVNVKDDEGHSVLSIATKNQQLDMVKVLIGNTTNEEKKASFFVAINGASTDIVKVFLNNGVDINVANDDNETALPIAAAKENLAMLTMLVSEGGVDPNLKNRDGRTALYVAVVKENVDMVKALFGATNKTRLESSSAFIVAATMNTDNAVEIVDIFIKNGADVNLEDDGKSILHRAIGTGHVKMVAALLNGVNIDIQSAFHAAFNTQSAEMVKLFVGDEKVVQDDVEIASSFLTAAAMDGDDVPAIVKLFIENGVNGTLTNKAGRTALDIAIVNERVPIVQALVDAKVVKMAGSSLVAAMAKGADNALQVIDVIFREDVAIDMTLSNADEGETLLKMAVDQNRIAMVKSLLNGASLKTDVAFLAAVNNGSTTIVQLFIEKGVDVNKVIEEGRNALSIATAKKDAETVKMLLSQRNLVMNLSIDLDADENQQMKELFISEYKKAVKEGCHDCVNAFRAFTTWKSNPAHVVPEPATTPPPPMLLPSHGIPPLPLPPSSASASSSLQEDPTNSEPITPTSPSSSMGAGTVIAIVIAAISTISIAIILIYRYRNRPTPLFGVELSKLPLVRDERFTSQIPSPLFDLRVLLVARSFSDRVNIFEKFSMDQSTFWVHKLTTVPRDLSLGHLSSLFLNFMRFMPTKLFDNTISIMEMEKAKTPADALAIIYSLPAESEPYRATIIYVLDILSNVAVKSDVNKMTSAILAGIFGEYFISRTDPNPYENKAIVTKFVELCITGMSQRSPTLHKFIDTPLPRV